MKTFYRTIVLALIGALLAATARATPGSEEGGKKIYERANCVGCHKWSGVGGGGYGGAALSLRATGLTFDQIKEIVTCGRPGTGMPHFTVDPYKGGACYGLKPDDVKDMMPPTATVVLGPDDIAEVAKYVVTTIAGKGEPTLTECTAFFGDVSRVCDIYRPHTEASAASRHPLPTPSTTGR